MNSERESTTGFQPEWVGGVHVVLTIVNERPEEVLEIWYARKRQDRLGEVLLAKARQFEIKVRKTGRAEIDRLLPGVNHQGVALRQSAVGYTDLEQLLNREPPADLLVAVDGLTDPRNLGGILRTAWAFRVDGILVGKHRTAGLTPAVVKVAAGAAGKVPVCRLKNLPTSLDQLKTRGFWIYGASADGEKVLEEVDFLGKVVVILGSEGKGVRPRVRSVCDLLFRIPMQETVESLNVSVAAGIILHRAYEMRNRP